MRRRLSLVLFAVLIVLMVGTVWRYQSLGRDRTRRVASAGAPRDSSSRPDSAAKADSQQAADTTCFAARIGLPCDPR
jgi:hypothetical protein